MSQSGNFIKNRERALPTFANINLLGKCNAKCFFCLGEDIPELLGKHNQLRTHFSRWVALNEFLHYCSDNDVRKLYVTGQNTDALLYQYLGELIQYLKDAGFKVGIRTNGYIALKRMDVINLCDLSVGYSIHSLQPEVNEQIMQRKDIPRWDSIIPLTVGPRVQVVVNRFNIEEVMSIVRYAAGFPNVKYIQVRRVCTDVRFDELSRDAIAYDTLLRKVRKDHEPCGTYYGADIFDLFGKPVCFWKTIGTRVNSFNYFTDGTWRDSYFVVESYKKARGEK